MMKKKFKLLLSIAGCLLAFGLVNGKPISDVQVNFYSAVLELPHLFCSELDLPQEMGREVIVDAYEHFENCSHAPFLSRLQQYRADYQLADWHYFEVVCLASEAVYKDKRFQTLFQWFVLRKSGIDVQLFYQGESAFLHAQCDDAEFGFYTIQHNNKRFINLTARREGLDLGNARAYVPDLMIDLGPSRPFSLKIESLPHLPTSDLIERTLEFTHHSQQHHLTVQLNKDQLSMMDDYPYYNQMQYFHMELSEEAERSLLPQMEAILEELTPIEKISLLLSFVRTSFFYKDDRRRFGREKPMTPEQTLYHTYSDCEDRSALFFYLVRRLVGLPAIVLDFEEHVGIAVELEGVKGNYFMHKGRRFVYCEATGPDDKLGIGEMWEYVKQMKARVMTDFIPN